VKQLWNAIVLPFAVMAANAQSPEVPAMNAGNRPSFEVESIKPGDPADFRRNIGFNPRGRFIANSASLRFLVRWAHRLQDFQVIGGPGWIDSEVFVIEAKSAGAPGGKLQDLSEAQSRSLDDLMHSSLQSLLADRFRLQVHRETRQHSVYELVVGKHGPKLVAASETNTPAPRQVVIGSGELKGTGAGMGILAQMLSRQLGVVVIDRTDLVGQYDFELKWSPDPVQPTGAEAPAPDSLGPSVFTAIQEQLGLRLEPSKAPVQVLVIDHAEKPSPN
jgi:uncharacterized protein (TIGR03435 family)